MSSWRNSTVFVVAALAAMLSAQAQTTYPGIGRAATPRELAAWDIDVRPDFKGLPPGSGSVAQGMDIWEARCASCHGVFGESNSTFSPLVGGTTAKDIESGRVARLTDPAFPGRSTLMKVPTLSTLWDYIHRAMPWNQPKSLSPDQVYAVTAYLLNLGGIVPDDYTLSDRNMAATQQRLPNRHGMTTEHGMWPGKGLGPTGRPDVRATACMKNCAGEPTLASALPDHARNNHGNLAEQNRSVGAQRGVDTSQPNGSTAVARVAPTSATSASPSTLTALALAKDNNCLTCHGVSSKIVGPALSDIGRKYAGRQDALAYLVQKIQAGGSGVWGPIPMPPQTAPGDHVKAIASWLADGAKP
jgi:cytochrome c